MSRPHNKSADSGRWSCTCSPGSTQSIETPSRQIRPLMSSPQPGPSWAPPEHGLPRPRPLTPQPAMRTSYTQMQRHRPLIRAPDSPKYTHFPSYARSGAVPRVSGSRSFDRPRASLTSCPKEQSGHVPSRVCPKEQSGGRAVGHVPSRVCPKEQSGGRAVGHVPSRVCPKEQSGGRAVGLVPSCVCPKEQSGDRNAPQTTSCVCPKGEPCDCCALCTCQKEQSATSCACSEEQSGARSAPCAKEEGEEEEDADEVVICTDQQATGESEQQQVVCNSPPPASCRDVQAEPTRLTVESGPCRYTFENVSAENPEKFERIFVGYPPGWLLRERYYQMVICRDPSENVFDAFNKCVRTLLPDWKDLHPGKDTVVLEESPVKLTLEQSPPSMSINGNAAGDNSPRSPGRASPRTPEGRMTPRRLIPSPVRESDGYSGQGSSPETLSPYETDDSSAECECEEQSEEPANTEETEIVRRTDTMPDGSIRQTEAVSITKMLDVFSHDAEMLRERTKLCPSDPNYLSEQEAEATIELQENVIKNVNKERNRNWSNIPKLPPKTDRNESESFLSQPWGLSPPNRSHKWRFGRNTRSMQRYKRTDRLPDGRTRRQEKFNSEKYYANEIELLNERTKLDPSDPEYLSQQQAAAMIEMKKRVQKQERDWSKVGPLPPKYKPIPPYGSDRVCEPCEPVRQQLSSEEQQQRVEMICRQAHEYDRQRRQKRWERGIYSP